MTNGPSPALRASSPLGARGKYVLNFIGNKLNKRLVAQKCNFSLALWGEGARRAGEGPWLGFFMTNFGYYIACLIVIIIGIFIVKKVVSCMIRAIVGLIVVAILAYVYFMYLR